MKIAVVAEGKTLDSKVSEQFEKCVYLLIINTEDLSITAIENDESWGDSSGEKLADEVLKYDCESVVFDGIEAKAFDIFADSYVTRFCGTGYSVEKVLELMEKRSLKLIKNLDGSQDCGGNHH